MNKSATFVLVDWWIYNFLGHEARTLIQKSQTPVPKLYCEMTKTSLNKKLESHCKGES